MGTPSSVASASTSQNLFEDTLRAAHSLGMQLPTTSTAHLTAALDAAMATHRSYASLYEQQLACLEAQHHADCQRITHAPLLQQRTAGLTEASATVRTVLAGKDAIAQRLRATKTEPTIPVQPELQPHLISLLQQSASSQATLQQGREALQWAAAFSEKPSCWEERLSGLLRAARACQDHKQALDQFGEALQALDSSSEGSGDGERGGDARSWGSSGSRGTGH